MKKLGLVGGIGPESTIQYYKGIIQGFRERTGKDAYPFMIIDSIDLSEMYDLAAAEDWDLFSQRLIDSVRVLASGGAEFAAMAANTAHIVFDKVQAESPLPLISIVEETCKAAKKEGLKRVIVFGTGFTMSSGLYSNKLAEYGIEAVVPDAEDQKAIHNIIFPNLEAGIVLPDEKEKILGIANKMIHQKGGEALVLGCTELPLIIQEGDLEVPLLDTTQIHINAILDYLLE
jgi:aspartate racemase